MSRLYCTECGLGEEKPSLGQSRAWRLPKGWVLRLVSDSVWCEDDSSPAGGSVRERTIQWLLCRSCALDITPVIHPEVRRVLEAKVKA